MGILLEPITLTCVQFDFYQIFKKRAQKVIDLQRWTRTTIFRVVSKEAWLFTLNWAPGVNLQA